MSRRWSWKRWSKYSASSAKTQELFGKGVQGFPLPEREVPSLFPSFPKKVWCKCTRQMQFGLLAGVPGTLRLVLLQAGIALAVLASGIGATVRNALGTLQLTSGLLFMLCCLRYPFVLLLLWASVNVGIGSSLTLLNGNHLDLVLVIPALLLQFFLPWREILRIQPTLLFLLFYLGWVLVGIELSPLSLQVFLTGWLTMLAMAAISALTIELVITRQYLFWLIDTLLFIALLVAFYGLYGFITHQHGEVDPGTGLFRITSIFTQATTFAFYLSLLVPLAIYRFCQTRGLKHLLSLFTLLCLLVAILLTFTRSAYVTVLVEVLVVAGCQTERQRWGRVIGGLIVCCGLVFLLSRYGAFPFLARFFNTDVTTLNGRIYLWQALLSHFTFTQWSGNGLQSSDALLASLHVGAYGRGVIGTAPHNLYLGTLYDHGLVGLLLLLAVLLTLAYSQLQGIRKSGGERRMLYVVALATLFAVMLQSLVSRDIWIQSVGIPFWIIVALPCAFCWSPSETVDHGQLHVEIMQNSRHGMETLPLYCGE